MSIPHNSHYYSLFQPNPPKLHRHIFSLYTFYYAIHNNSYIPIAISKPNSTQLPHYYTSTQPTFPTLQSLLNHYTSHNSLT
jgi:hypothetical protein